MGLIHPTRALTQYHPYRITSDTGEKIKNPKFDEVSGRLLDLKDATQPKHRQAVEQMTLLLSDTLNSIPYTLIPVQLYVVVVPSSTRGRWSDGLCSITAEICSKQPKRFVSVSQALERTRTIEKLARGGDRSIDVHISSIGVVPRFAGYFARKAVLLLDDVTTTGNSLRACSLLLQQQGADSIYPIALGRTTS